MKRLSYRPDGEKEGYRLIEKIKMATARTERGITQEQMATSMKVSKGTIVAWEKGRIIPKPAQFEMYCRICGFSTDDIFLPTKLT